MEGYEKCTFGHMLIVAGVLSCFISFFVACELSLIYSMFFFKTFPWRANKIYKVWVLWVSPGYVRMCVEWFSRNVPRSMVDMVPMNSCVPNMDIFAQLLKADRWAIAHSPRKASWLHWLLHWVTQTLQVFKKVPLWGRFINTLGL